MKYIMMVRKIIKVQMVLITRVMMKMTSALLVTIMKVMLKSENKFKINLLFFIHFCCHD